MPPTLPCPNPVCTYVFNADAVMGAASVVCPRCGTKLEFRAPPPARPPAPTAKASPSRAPPPPKAAAKAKPAKQVRPVSPLKPAAPPLAVPVVAAPVVPMATPVKAEPPAGLVFNSQPDMLLRPPERRRGLPGWLIALFLVVGVFGGMAALIFGAIVASNNWGAHNQNPSGLSGEEKKAFAQQGNFRLDPPAKPWERDARARLGAGTAVAYHRSKPDGFMALLFRDYQTRQPRDAELIDEGLNRLRDHMNDVEYAIKPSDDQAILGGQQGVRFEFQCEDKDDHVQMHGQCVATTARGVGYWFYTWAPVDDADGQADEWTDLRGKFALSDQRAGWTEKPPNLLNVTGNKLPYRLEYAGYDREKKKEGLWEKQDPDGYDPRADLVLLGYDPRDDEPRSGSKAATVQVLALEKAADLPAAVKEAKDALLEIEKHPTPDGGYLNPGAALNAESVKGLANADNDAAVGGFKGHLLKLEAQPSPDHSNYVLLAVVRLDGGDVLAVVCECAWEQRDFWDQEFAALLARLRPKAR